MSAGSPHPPPPPYLSRRSTMGTSEQPESPAVVDSVVKAFQNLTTDANYKLVSDMFNEVNYLKEQNNTLKLTNRSMFEEYRDFRNELEEHEKQLQETKDALETTVAEKEQEITRLDEARRQLSEAKASLETDLVEKDHELAAIDQFASRLQDEKNEVEALLAQARAELGEIKGTQSKLADEKAALEAELVKLGEEKARLDTLLAEATRALDEVTQAKVTLTEERSALEKLVRERNAELETLRNEKLSLADEKDVLNNTLSEKEGDLAALKEANSKGEADLSDANTKIGELTKNINEKAAKAEELKTQLSALRTTMEQRDAEYAVAKQDLAKMAEQIKKLETQGTALESELEEMTARMQEKAGLVETLDVRVTDLTKELEGAVVRINKLEAELKEATKTAEERQIRISSLESEMNDLQTAAQTQVERLESKLSSLTSTNTKLQQDLSTAQSNLATALQDLTTKTSCLTELNSLRVSLSTDSEDTYVTLLDSIWTRIASLIETTFRQDLSPSTLSDESCWTNLLQSPHTRHIPLPRTNTPAAKQMRIAVILSLLSRSLHTHIFRPVYLTSSGGEESLLPQILHTIGLANPSHEEHTRATLLAMLPAEKQRAFGAKRVAAVVREVSYAVQHLLNALQYEAFCNGLEQVVKLACGQWMRIQMGKMRVEPYFGPPFGEFDWQVLPLPVIEERDDLVVEVGRPVEEGQEAVTSPHHPVEDREVGPDDIMLVVWPSMCVVENGELESITQGLVISKDQVRAATDEVRGRGKQRPGAKRARTLSMPGRGVSGQAFLPQAGKADSVDG